MLLGLHSTSASISDTKEGASRRWPMAVIHLTLCPLMSDMFYSEAEHRVMPSAGSRHDPQYNSAFAADRAGNRTWHVRVQGGHSRLVMKAL